MHNAVGMWFTPLTLGMLYYALPKTLSRPIYSYALGVFAFWTNLVFYPIIGSHHFLFSRCRGGCRPPPSSSAWRCWCRCGRQQQFLLTMRGRLRDLVHSYPLMFIFVG